MILLTNVLEEKAGPFVRDVNPSVSSSGDLIHQWMASVKAHRASEQAQSRHLSMVPAFTLRRSSPESHRVAVGPGVVETLGLDFVG